VATPQQVESFRSANNALIDLAARDLESVWAGLDLSDARQVKAVLESMFPDLVQTYGSTAALLAVDYYDELRGVAPTAARFSTVMAESVDVEQAQAKARWAIGPLFGVADPDQAFSNLGLGLDHLVKQFGRDTIAKNAAKDPSKARWARVPGGRETCSWCLIMASRGAVYGSKVSAGGDMNKYHGKCDCTPTPIWSEADMPYDADSIYEKYLDIHDPGMTIKQTAAEFRAEYGTK
jgi:hypothetical protein